MNTTTTTACSAVAQFRARLEEARDARAGRLADPQVLRDFRALSVAFGAARQAHRDATGCTSFH